eukprot:scaffold63920_cov18-Tisochrysis_lutea.AAC.1
MSTLDTPRETPAFGVRVVQLGYTSGKLESGLHGMAWLWSVTARSKASPLDKPSLLRDFFYTLTVDSTIGFSEQS